MDRKKAMTILLNDYDAGCGFQTQFDVHEE